jgi:hypothetical protein
MWQQGSLGCEIRCLDAVGSVVLFWKPKAWMHLSLKQQSLLQVPCALQEHPGPQGFAEKVEDTENSRERRGLSTFKESL